MTMTLPLPPGAAEAVFAEPWPAHAFALAGQIAAAQAEGDADQTDTYYRHWLTTLERLVVAKGASSEAELEVHRLAWDHAADRAPHGQPIELRPDDLR